MNRYALVAVSLLVALVGTLVLSWSVLASPAHAAPKCTVTALGSSPNLTVSCVDENGEPISPSDIDVRGVAGDTVTVVVDRTKTVVKTVIKRVQAPRRTVTIRPQPVVRTRTIRLPGHSHTVFVTKRPEPKIVRQTVISPGPTVTITTSPSRSRQPTPERDTMDTITPGPAVQFRDGRVTVQEVGLGFLAAAILAAVALAVLYAGYILGYKDKERSDTSFMRALLDAAALRRTR